MVPPTPPNKFPDCSVRRDSETPVPAPEPKKKMEPEPGWDANGSPTDEVPVPGEA